MPPILAWTEARREAEAARILEMRIGRVLCFSSSCNLGIPKKVLIKNGIESMYGIFPNFSNQLGT